MNKLISLLFVTFATILINAAVYNVDNIPNVHIEDKLQFVSDPDKYMSDDARNITNRYLRTLMDSTSVEVAIVLVESIGDNSIDVFSQKLFDKWEIGKADKDNGLLLLFVMDQRLARIHTGYGLEGIIPDITAKNIINHDIVPHMKKGDIDSAIVDATKRISMICNNPDTKDEIWSNKKNDVANSNNAESDELSTTMIIIVLLAFIFSLTLFFNNVSKLKGKTNYQKSEIMRNNIWLIGITSVLSALTGVIFFILAILLSRHFRNKRIKCDNCNTAMNKLSEEEDNKYLSPAQDHEEQIKSVDYDVWLCPKCGETEIFPFKNKTSTYKECPHCHTYASTHIFDKITRKPTVIACGIGQHIYECQYCKKRHEVKYEIPKVAPVVPIGVNSHSGGRGGGFSGGSFGGGMSGGGGASGGW